MFRFILLNMVLFSIITAQNPLIESPAGPDAPEYIKPDVILPELPKTTPKVLADPENISIKSTFTMNKQIKSEVLDSIIYQTSNGGIKEIFTFTDKGNIEVHTVQKQNAETLTWENSSRYTYTYDDGGRVQTKLIEEWSVDYLKWISSWYYTNSYDDQGNLIYVLYQIWDNQDMLFLNHNRYFYNYDDQNNLISFGNQIWSYDQQEWVKEKQYSYIYRNDKIYSTLYERWDTTTGEYLIATRLTYQYTNTGKTQYYIHESWNTTTQSWVNEAQYFYTYDENDHLSLYEYQYWDGSQWKNSQQIEYTYDSDGHLLSYKALNWDDINQEWVYSSAQNYTYDDKGYSIEYILQWWDADSQSWINKNRYTYTRNSSGYILNSLFQTWDENLSDWQNTGLYTYEWNANNQIVSQLYQKWDMDDNAWVDSNLQNYEYTPGGYLSHFTAMLWSASDWQPLYSSVYYNYDEIIVTSFYCSEFTAYYEDVTGISARETAPRVFSLNQNFPNPFNPETTIEYRLSRGGLVTIRVYNTLGEEVAVLVNKKIPAGKHSVTFDAAHLSSGMYMYTMSVDDRTVSVKKMMLLR